MTELKFASKTSDAQSIFLFMHHEMMGENGSSPTDMHLCILSNTHPSVPPPTIYPSIHPFIHPFIPFLESFGEYSEMRRCTFSYWLLPCHTFMWPWASLINSLSLRFFTGKYRKWPRLVVLNLLTTGNFLKSKILLRNLHKINEIAVLCMWNLENRSLESC